MTSVVAGPGTSSSCVSVTWGTTPSSPVSRPSGPTSLTRPKVVSGVSSPGVPPTTCTSATSNGGVGVATRSPRTPSPTTGETPITVVSPSTATRVTGAASGVCGGACPSYVCTSVVSAGVVGAGVSPRRLSTCPTSGRCTFPTSSRVSSASVSESRRVAGV